MLKFLISIVVLSMLSLTGCAVIELGHLAYYVATNTSVGTEWNSTQEIKPIEGQYVYAATFSTPNKSGTKCDADGVVVDYARDWDVIDEHTGQITFKADPKKIYGQAIVLYHMECNHGLKSDVLLTGERRQIIGQPLKLNLLEKTHTTDFHTTTEFRKPRWMTQVLETILREAPTNPAALKFLQHVPLKNG